MFRISSLFLALGVAVAVTACTNPTPAESPGDQSATPTAGAAQEPDAQAIFASYKTDPEFVKVTTSPFKSGPHMGDVEIYVDKAHADQYKTVGAEAPDGMTVVKASVEEPQRAYIMKKIKGYDPDNSDWYYANTKSDGTVEMTGKIQMCISCHGGFKSTDYLAAPASEYAADNLK